MKTLRLILTLLFVSVFFSCATTDLSSDNRDEMSLYDSENKVNAKDLVTNDLATNDTGNNDSDATSDIETNAGGENTFDPAAGQGVEADSSEVQPLSTAEFKQAVINKMPWNMSAVYDGAAPLSIIHDLDKNGYNDALVVAVEGENNVGVSLDELSKSARLFQSGQQSSNFVLLIFYQYSNEVILRYTVPVANQLVFNGVEPFEIKQGSDFPYSLLFTFRTRAGIEKELIILSGHGITRFNIHENLSEITLIEDIDEDGYQDIIVHEQGFEEGTGFETFLTWYKWNLREYTEYKNTNIVRNLRQFYVVCAEYLREGEYASFLNYALDSETLSALKKQNLSDEEILEKIFQPVEEPAEDVVESVFFTEDGFTAVVFPELMETPFSYANRRDFSHQVGIRFRQKSGVNKIYLSELKMKKNPFQSRQFCFSVDAY